LRTRPARGGQPPSRVKVFGLGAGLPTAKKPPSGGAVERFRRPDCGAPVKRRVRVELGPALALVFGSTPSSIETARSMMASASAARASASQTETTDRAFGCKGHRGLSQHLARKGFPPPRGSRNFRYARLARHRPGPERSLVSRPRADVPKGADKSSCPARSASSRPFTIPTRRAVTLAGAVCAVRLP